MDNKFLIIAITPEIFFEGEADKISQILRNGEADIVHIRKPGSNKNQVADLIENIPLELHCRLKLHDHFELLDNYDLGGIHLNSRNPFPHPKAKAISRSIHAIEEISEAKDFDYYFISPIFDSISKEGYKSNFDLKELAEIIKDTRGIALGGVTPDKLPALMETGFYGAAMLGHFFRDYLST